MTTLLITLAPVWAIIIMLLGASGRDQALAVWFFVVGIVGATLAALVI